MTTRRDGEVSSMSATPDATLVEYGSGAFRDRILHAPDVCSNCFSLIRHERVDPVRWSQERELESTYERDRQQTVVGYHETHSVEPTQAKETYCECGVTGSHDRFWSADDVDRSKFQELLKHMIRSAEHKGISFRRRTTAKMALQRYKDTGEVDTALALGLDAGMHAEVAADD